MLEQTGEGQLKGDRTCRKNKDDVTFQREDTLDKAILKETLRERQTMLKVGLVRLIVLNFVLWFFPASVVAAPSAFPETAAFFGVGYRSSVGISAGLEVVLPVPYLDVSVGAEGRLATAGDYGIRLYGTALVFPALATTPPLALAVGADVDVGSDGFALHAGPVLGNDLLFTSKLPMTLSLYLAPGYSTATGFSLAWAGQVRYYFDTFALELASSDTAYISISVRYFF